MVLVDLSETVTSMLVTEGLDIFDALGLLLKPEGIMVKNEEYFEKMSNIFEHTMDIQVLDVPFICSQTLIMGSNAKNFVMSNITDHGVQSLFYDSFNGKGNDYEMLYRYQKNSNVIKKHCSDAGRQYERTMPTQQKHSPGIFMVLELENVGARSETLEEIVTKSVGAAGLTAVGSTELLDNGEVGKVVTIAMKEGYIIARIWPDRKYCAVDAHLWSSFEKHELLKEALLKNFKGGSGVDPTLSSFRIVAGGMFGIETWKDDDVKRGPRAEEGFCGADSEPEQEATAEVKSSNAQIVHVENLAPLLGKSIDHDRAVVLVLCDSAGKECSTMDSMVASLKERQSKLDTKVVFPFPVLTHLRACPGTTADDVDKMNECMSEVKKLLAELGSEKVSAVVLDPGAPMEIAQIFHRIAKEEMRATGSVQILDEKAAIIAWVDEGQAWRKHFLSRFSNDIFSHFPSRYSEIKVGGATFGFVSNADNTFMHKLRKLTDTVGGVIDYVMGGLYPYQETVGSKFFPHESYDQTSPLQQWKSQQPIGHQTVLQFEREKAGATLPLGADEVEAARIAIKKTLEGSVAEEFDVRGDGNFDVIHWTGGNAVFLWDGRSHIDVHLFTFDEDFALPNKISRDLRASIRQLQEVLKDDYPRGYGRVVNFRSDIEPRIEPHWATFKLG